MVKALSTGTKTVNGPAVLKMESNPVLFIRLTNIVALVELSRIFVIVLLPGVMPDGILGLLQAPVANQRNARFIRKTIKPLGNLIFIKSIGLKLIYIMIPGLNRFLRS